MGTWKSNCLFLDKYFLEEMKMNKIKGRRAFTSQSGKGMGGLSKKACEGAFSIYDVSWGITRGGGGGQASGQELSFLDCQVRS